MLVSLHSEPLKQLTSIVVFDCCKFFKCLKILNISIHSFVNNFFIKFLYNLCIKFNIVFT